MRRRLTLHGLVALTTCALTAPSLGRGFALFDAGELLYLADRLREGGVPGVDYHVTAYGPGQYAALAGLQSLFGDQLGTIWGYFLGLRLLSAAAALEVGLRVGAGAMRFLPVATLLAAPPPLHKGIVPLVLLVIACAQTIDAAPARARWGGLAAALLAPFRLDLALGGAILTALFAPGFRQRSWMPTAALLLIGAFGLAAIGALPAVAQQSLRHGVVAHEDDAAFLLSAFVRAPVDAALASVPFVLAPALALRAVLRGDALGTRLASLACLSLVHLLGKADPSHLQQVAPVLAAAAAGRPSRAWFAIPLGLLLHSAGLHRGDLYGGGLFAGVGRTERLDTARGPLWLNHGERRDLGAVLLAIDEAPPGPLWAPGGQPALYALSRRRDPTGAPSFVHLVGDASAEARARDRLLAHPPVLVVLRDDRLDGAEEGLAALPLLGAVLAERYREAGTAGGFRLLRPVEARRARPR